MKTVALISDLPYRFDDLQKAKRFQLLAQKGDVDLSLTVKPFQGGPGHYDWNPDYLNARFEQRIVIRIPDDEPVPKGYEELKPTL